MATTTTTKLPTLAELYAEMKQREQDVYSSQTARKTEIENILGQQLAMYETGGAFEKASLGELERTKTRDVGATSQNAISSGLYGMRPYGQEWEANVGSSARLKLEDIMQQRRSSVLSAKASFLENIQEPYPDYSSLMNAFTSAYSAGRGGGGGGYGGGGGVITSGGTYGASSFPDMFTMSTGSGGGSGTGATYMGANATMGTSPISAATQTTPMSSTNAAKKATTYEQFASIVGETPTAKGRKEWEAARKYY